MNPTFIFPTNPTKKKKPKPINHPPPGLACWHEKREGGASRLLGRAAACCYACGWYKNALLSWLACKYKNVGKVIGGNYILGKIGLNPYRINTAPPRVVTSNT